MSDKENNVIFEKYSKIYEQDGSQMSESDLAGHEYTPQGGSSIPTKILQQLDIIHDQLRDNQAEDVMAFMIALEDFLQSQGLEGYEFS